MLNKRLWLSIGLLLFLGGCEVTNKHREAKELAQKRFNQQKANIKYVLALEQYENGQITQASQSIREAIGLYMGAPEYYVLMAKIYIEEGDLVNAKEALQFIAYQGEPQAAYFYLAGLLAERYGNLDEACQHYQQAHKLDRLKIAHVMSYAEILVHLQRYEDALQLVENRLPDFDGEGRMCALKGEILQLLNRYAEAADAFGSALLQYPGDPLLLESRAMALFWSQRYTEALPALRELQKVLGSPTPRHVSQMLARCSMEIGDYISAASYLKGISRADTEDLQAWRVWLELARCDIAMSDYNTALKSAKRAVELAPEKSGTQLTLGFIYCRQENWIEALRALEAAVRVDPSDYTALCLLGQVSEATGRPSRALACYKRALQLDPGDTLANHFFAHLQEKEMEEVQMSIHPGPLDD